MEFERELNLSHFVHGKIGRFWFFYSLKWILKYLIIGPLFINKMFLSIFFMSELLLFLDEMSFILLGSLWEVLNFECFLINYFILLINVLSYICLLYNLMVHWFPSILHKNLRHLNFYCLLFHLKRCFFNLLIWDHMYFLILTRFKVLVYCQT